MPAESISLCVGLLGTILLTGGLVRGLSDEALV
jgi:hypothetical protein